MSVPVDTIAAISTAPGNAGVAVVRVSGPASLIIADATFRTSGPPPSARQTHTIVHGRVVAESGEVLDHALLMIMRSPRSFTGEDVVEFHCHGGHISVTRVLRRLLECGCRPADPGEFARRAFLSGKMDLTQAESVMDLIQANSERSASAALRQLQGGLRQRIDALYDRILSVSAALESSLDFPEDEIPHAGVPALVMTLFDCRTSCLDMAASCRRGRLLRDGVRVAIAGRPNVGKSSLFNLLVAANRSIVSNLPGTTRDTIEEWISIAGHGIRLVDTAGLRTSDCPVEREGVRRSLAEMESSDLVLYVMDALDPAHPEDLSFLASANPGKTLVIINKVDLHPSPDLPSAASRFRSLKISCSELVNIETIAHTISKLMDQMAAGYEFCEPAVSERHKRLLDDAAESIRTAMEILNARPEDGPALASPGLRNAADSLGAISGRTYTDDLLDQIFSRFCIGK